MRKITKNIFPLEWNLSDDLVVSKSDLKVFGTFVCGGGSTMGYKLAGFNHIGGVEFTEHYSRVYKKNHNPKYFYTEDIRDFNKREDLPSELYDLDLLDGSPPCAAFSTVGAREKVWGKKSKYEDKSQVKDDLVFIYCDTIKKLKPKTFILENVSGLTKGNAKSYLHRIIKRMSKTYNVQAFLIKASDVGIPQMRQRVFIIGSRKDLNFGKLNLEFDCPKVGFDCTKKFWDIEEPNLDIRNYAIYKQWKETEIGKSHEKRFSLCKPYLNKPCYTITEKSSNQSAASVCHPIKPRKLNGKEVSLLSTFPMDYNFLDVTPSSVMGRSVLPVVMANISYQIRKQWFENE